MGEQLPESERTQIARQVQEVEAALASGEVQRLKKANAALDAATQTLATLLVEKAMEEALQRKLG